MECYKNSNCYNFALAKVDSCTYLPLQGALYILDDGFKKRKYRTDRNGRLCFSLVKGHIYRLYEIVPPCGYQLDSREFMIEVDDDGACFVDGNWTSLIIVNVAKNCY